MFKKKPSLTTMIFIAMILGAILGITVGAPMKQIGFIGDIWLNCIKMMVVPMVFTTITAGIAAQKDAKSIGRIGVRITLYYIFTTLMACAVGLIVANILKPGVGLSLMGMESQSVDLAMSDFSVSSFFMSLFSDNIFKTFTEGNIIQTLVISAFFGIAILKMQNEAHKDVVVRAFESFNSLIFDIIGIVMKLSPIGVFCLMASSFGEYGINVFKSRRENMRRKCKAIVIGGNHYNTLGVIRSLGEMGVPVYLILISEKGGYVSKSKYIVNSWYVDNSEDAIINVLSNNFINEECKPVIIPTSDFAMKTIIVGGGKIGYNLLKTLKERNHQLVIPSTSIANAFYLRSTWYTECDVDRHTKYQ